MPQITANNLQIEYEAFGAESAPAILLIMGLGAQLARWNIELCEALVDRGYRVIRFDNRDCGLSSKLDQILSNQRSLMEQMDSLKQELNIIKIRVTQQQ